MAEALCPVEEIRRCRYQPRVDFDERALSELAATIREIGIVQPIVVRPNPDGSPRYELVAGERRWRAAQLAGVADIPVIVREYNDDQVLQVAFVENYHRQDLNAIEEARHLASCKELMGLTLERLGELVGLDKTSVLHRIRLLDLPRDAQDLIAQRRLTTGHGKALLQAPENTRAGLARRAAAGGWSVRRLEQEARGLTRGVRSEAEQRKDPNVAALEERLQAGLSCPVRIDWSSGKKGQRVSVNLEFFSLDEFDGFLSRLGLDP